MSRRFDFAVWGLLILYMVIGSFVLEGEIKSREADTAEHNRVLCTAIQKVREAVKGQNKITRDNPIPTEAAPVDVQGILNFVNARSAASTSKAISIIDSVKCKP